MRSDLDHLPEAKRHELEHVVELVREGFAEAISRRTMERFRNGKILKIILFGSHGAPCTAQGGIMTCKWGKSPGGLSNER